MSNKLRTRTGAAKKNSKAKELKDQVVEVLEEEEIEEDVFEEVPEETPDEVETDSEESSVIEDDDNTKAKADSKTESKKSAPAITVTAPSQSKAAEKRVRVKLKADFRTYIGDRWYTFKKGKEESVPENVKVILAKAGMLDVL